MVGLQPEAMAEEMTDECCNGPAYISYLPTHSSVDPSLSKVSASHACLKGLKSGPNLLFNPNIPLLVNLYKC